ncbi:MAG: amino acid racemase [Burkholderiaceae bacterium]|jgi:aspartate racemase
MTQHIGILACSAEGAALCYRTICTEGPSLLGDHNHPEVSIHTFPLLEYLKPLRRGDWAGVAELMLASSEKLVRSGADFFICPDNTIHEALPLIRSRLARPWLHIAEVVADSAFQAGFQRLGLTGTRWLVNGALYPDALGARGLRCIRPSEEDCQEIDRIIIDELVNGVIRSEATDYFLHVVAKLKDQGCEAVILGCTELPLIANNSNSALPVLDSTRLLARAALRVAIGTPISVGK